MKLVVIIDGGRYAFRHRSYRAMMHTTEYMPEIGIKCYHDFRKFNEFLEQSYRALWIPAGSHYHIQSGINDV